MGSGKVFSILAGIAVFSGLMVAVVCIWFDVQTSPLLDYAILLMGASTAFLVSFGFGRLTHGYLLAFITEWLGSHWLDKRIEACRCAGSN